MKTFKSFCHLQIKYLGTRNHSAILMPQTKYLQIYEELTDH